MSPTERTDPVERLRLAQVRLAHSREAIQASLMPAVQPEAADARSRHRSLADWQRLLRHQWRRLRREPVMSMAGEVAQQWWSRHPWQPAGQALYGQLRASVWPLVRRHPVASVAVAAAVGGAVVASRPWNWPWLNRRARRLPTQLGHWVWRQLSAAPMQAALAGLLALAVKGGLDQAQQTPTKSADGGTDGDGTSAGSNATDGSEGPDGAQGAHAFEPATAPRRSVPA